MITLNTETTCLTEPGSDDDRLIHRFTCPGCLCVQSAVLPSAVSPTHGWLLQFFECSCGEILGLRQA